MLPKNNIDLTHVFENRNFNALKLAKIILESNLENDLLIYALHKDQTISNRAIWVLNHCADLDFERVKPFQIRLINHLKHKNTHSGVIRSILRIYQNQPVPKKLQSFMLDKCFEYIKNPTEAIAIRAYAMTVVFNISKAYPELLNELSIVLHHLDITGESAAVNARARIILEKVSKLKSK